MEQPKKQRRKPAIAVSEEDAEQKPAEVQQLETASGDLQDVDGMLDVIPEEEVDEQAETDQPTSAVKGKLKPEEEEQGSMPAPRQRFVALILSARYCLPEQYKCVVHISKVVCCVSCVIG